MRQGTQESLVIEDPWLVFALFSYARTFAPGDLLRRASPPTMRVRLRTILEELRLPSGFQWYSLRRGGATHAFRVSNSLSSICVVGRWNNQRTARIYLADALAQLTEISFEDNVVRRLKRLAMKARPGFSFDL